MRWGLFGAAGVLFRHHHPEHGWRYLLQLRGHRTHQGGTWGVPGGALDEGEDPVDGALREAGEELGDLPEGRVDGAFRHQVAEDWSYTTIICTVEEAFAADTTHWETAAARWVTAAEAEGLPLHPAFAEALPEILATAEGLSPDRFSLE
jgi:ADP-ribose pyrophosphatase YjhB (NUDIX family)